MHSLSGDDEDLAAKCFGLCQALVSQNRSFSFALNVSSFSFSLDTRELASNKQKAEKKMKKKKPSPSTIRRSARRKEEYLKKKALKIPGRITSDSSASEPGSVLPVQPKGSGSTPPSRPGRPLRILGEIYTLPPKSVRSSISKLGRGFFVEIDKDTANFVYEFENGELYEF